jgi:SAM-dependent methyltransferase
MAERDWQSFHARNPRGPKMAELWTRGVVRWLRDHGKLGPSVSVLDFGCGYFDLGAAIAAHAGRIDGLEIDEHAFAVSQGRAKQLPAAAIHRTNDDLPSGRYDLIVMNSVLQYLKNEEDVLITLRLFQACLKPGGRGEVLLVDLIPPRYSPALDAVNSMMVAVRHGIPLQMFRYLMCAAMARGCNSWLRVSPDQIARLAESAGFTCTTLPRNLSPSRQRFTCLLRQATNTPPR